MGSMAPINMEYSSMRISKKTLERLAKWGEKNDSYEDIVNAVLDKLEAGK